MLLTGTFKYELVPFQDKVFITRSIYIPKWGEMTIGDEALEKLLLFDGEYVSDEARQIDEGIGYFITGWKLRSLSDEELAIAVARELSTDIVTT